MINNLINESTPALDRAATTRNAPPTPSSSSTSSSSPSPQKKEKPKVIIPKSPAGIVDFCFKSFLLLLINNNRQSNGGDSSQS